MNSLILLRGLPGSGKTTLAKELSENGKYPVFSVDDYFTASNGDYHFEFDKNHLAYKQCEENTKASMQKGDPKIFIDNVFSLEWELEPYFKLAAEYEMQYAKPLEHNKFKVELGKRSIVRALMQAMMGSTNT